MPEAQTLLMVSEPLSTGMPTRVVTCRAIACIWPAWTTVPMNE